MSGELGAEHCQRRRARGPSTSVPLPVFLFLNLPSLPFHLSISVSFCFSGHFLLSPHPPFLSPPLSISLLLAFLPGLLRDGETGGPPPITAQLPRHMHPRAHGQGTGFWAKPEGAQLGPLPPPTSHWPWPSAWGTQGFIPRAPQRPFPGPSQCLLGATPTSHPQVPLLCFYILNWRFIFNIYYLRRALCCEGGPWHGVWSSP